MPVSPVEEPDLVSEEEIVERRYEVSSDEDEDERSAASARRGRSRHVCGYFFSRACRSDAATIVILLMATLLIAEHYAGWLAVF